MKSALAVLKEFYAKAAEATALMQQRVDGYVATHKISAAISEAVEAAVLTDAEDPFAFIAEFLTRHANDPQAPVKGATPPKTTVPRSESRSHATTAAAPRPAGALAPAPPPPPAAWAPCMQPEAVPPPPMAPAEKPTRRICESRGYRRGRASTTRSMAR